MSGKLKAIDLFCGCGGISAGLRDAGFQVLAGVDVEPNYISTFSHNFPRSKSFQLDLAAVQPDEFMRSIGVEEGEVDLLAGGPPRQGFSKNVPRKNRYLEDPRNELIKIFLNYCEELKPRFVLMENVAEMKNGFENIYTDEVVSRLSEKGYTVTYAVLNSAEFGVPQRRRRAFFLANRDGIKFSLPEQTHSKKTSGGLS